MSTYGQQVGWAAESTWGTVVTPDHFLPLVDESLEYDPTFAASDAIQSGGFGEPASRAQLIRFQAAGGFTVELAYSKLGLLLKQLMGSSGTATLVSGTAYKQVHQIGTTDGKSLSLQLGRNETSTSTVKPYTYPGTKIVGGEISVSDGDSGAAHLALTADAKTESTATALASAVFPTGANAPAFNFGSVTAVKLGGTAATTSGVIAVTGGAQATTVFKSFNLSIASPAAADRYGLGNAGAKLEQVNNAQPTVTGTLGGEFTLQSEIYDVWKAGTVVPLQVTFTGPQIAATGSFYTFDIILPAVKLLKAPPHINGYDVTTQSIDFKAYRDDTGGNNMCQITYINADTAL